MPTETEIKVQVSDLARLRERLDEAGFQELQPRAFEDNVLFDALDRTLSGRGQILRLRTVGDRNPDAKIAELELELKHMGNNIGMGAMGFVGNAMVADCHIEVGYTHTGGMPMSVHTFCLSSRRATVRIHADGRCEYRHDPQWFTPYMRRETIEWPMPEHSEKQSV